MTTVVAIFRSIVDTNINLFSRRQHATVSANTITNILRRMAEQVNDNSMFTGVRLPAATRPIHYDLHLKPDLKNFTYEGSVKIEYKGCPAPPRSIVLHANELVIFEGYVHSLNQEHTVHPLKKVTYSKDTETATLEFSNDVPELGSIFLKFTGTLNDKMKGFYRTCYKVNDEVVYGATTQFEATDARRCFPCWDEPACKATFTVTMVHDVSDGRKRIALSNTPASSPIPLKDGLIETRFSKTPKMSTYLLAFCVGEFEALEGTDGKRPIRVYTTLGKKEHGQYALDVACKSLQFYENYFGIDYPLEKMDLIAIPDFASGAMENWGLVTYRETCLLVDPNNTATDRKQYVALVVAHEIAHQWFGNLVTMEWWTHLWLNEGFASFMEFLCIDHIFPEYDIWSQFVTNSYTVALNLDSLNNSHPIEVPVQHPSEIDEIFDEISYNKGASVIRMLYKFIGDESFRAGMKQYLTKFAYKNAATEDLWESLETASSKPVCKLMSGWTSQKGFPWLSVSYSIEGDNAKLTITQNKFTANGEVSADEADIKWLIPIAAVTGSNPEKSGEISLFEGKSGVITVEEAGDSWIKLNPGTVSFYRTAYPPDMADKLWPAIRDQSLPPMDRLGLQNDFFALCQAGKVQTVDLLKLLEAFKNETDYTVWTSIDSCLGKLSILLSNTDYVSKFHAFGRNLYSEIFKKLTWSTQSNGSHTNAMTRALVINRLVAFGDTEVIEESKRRCKAQLAKTETIPADLRGAVYRAVSVHGDDECFEALFDIYRNSELNEEQNRALRALGFAKDPERLKRAVNFALSKEVRNQDKIFVFMPIGVNNPPVAWKILQDNKDMLRETYETGHLICRLVKFSTENFASEEMAQEVSKFFEENKFPGTERTVQQALETIRLNANWLARDSEAIKAYLHG